MTSLWYRSELMGRFLNPVYFRQVLTCTLGLTNDLIDGGQPRAKKHDLFPLYVGVRRQGLALGWPPSINKSLVNPRVYIRLLLKNQPSVFALRVQNINLRVLKCEMSIAHAIKKGKDETQIIT